MGMDADVRNTMDEAELKPGNMSLFAVSNGENGIIESDMFMKMLTRMEIDLAYSSEKLVNLDNYMTTIISLDDTGLKELPKDDISEVEIEKALLFDLLFGYVHSEVTEIEHFLSFVRMNITGAHQDTHSWEEHIQESNTALQPKVHSFGSSWKDLQKKVSEINQQLADLHRTISTIQPNSLYSLEDDSLDGFGENFGQRRLVLEMLEKSLAVEFGLKKQLQEAKQREEDQKLKILLANEAVSKMETFAEIALERLLEAEYSSDTLMRSAKEMMFKFHILQFNMQCSAQREGDLKSELQKKEHALAEVHRKYEKMRLSSKDKEPLEVQVELLEKKLRHSESKLKEVNESYEDALESLKEHIFMAESRAHIAETKISNLTEENMELREELDFLKVEDGNEEKVGLLEKQVRDLEAQLQTARGASDMLYTAIWDMETLIEELKSKVSKGETMVENAEEQCLALAERNIELTKEISFWKSKSDKLDENLKEANRAKIAWGKDVDNGAKLITEMVIKLSSERERIQKQLLSLARENKILLHELRKMRKNSFKGTNGYTEDDTKELNFTAISRPPSTSEDLGEALTSATVSNQVDDRLEQNTIDGNETADFPASDDATCGSLKNEGNGKSKHLNKLFFIFASFCVLGLCVLAAMIISRVEISSNMRHHSLSFK